jgi:hypothetical protein
MTPGGGQEFAGPRFYGLALEMGLKLKRRLESFLVDDLSPSGKVIHPVP